MSKTIDTEDYCRAFETWAALPGAPLDDHEREAVRAVCAHLREHVPGAHPIRTLCDTFGERIDDDPNLRHLRTSIVKSCLLARLIYGGEKLRTTPCPKHKGRWSGWSFDKPCPHGCNSGPNVTGWIAEP